MTLKGCTAGPGPQQSVMKVLVCLTPLSVLSPIPGLYHRLSSPLEIPLASVRRDMVLGPGCVMCLRNTCILREELDESFANSQVKMINDRTPGIWRGVFEGA